MKLLVKFNILLIVVFGLGLLVIAYQARTFLQEQAQAEVLREAGLMAASALATRNYTEHYITPVVEKTTEHTTTFLPRQSPSSHLPLPLIKSDKRIRTTPTRKRR